MIITSIIAMCISPVIAITVSCRTPVTIMRAVESYAEPSCRTTNTYTKGKSPSGIGVIMHTKSISYRARVIIAAIPGPVIISGTIVNTSSINIRMHIAGRIAHIDYLRSIIVDVNIFYIVNRAFGRYLLNRFRDGYAYLPGTVWLS
jgi:hypothetical protein